MTAMTTTPSGLQYEDTVLGTGAIAKAGQNVKVHYTGWLYNDGVKAADLGSSAAQSVILMIIVISLTVIQFRFVEKKVQY